MPFVVAAVAVVVVVAAAAVAYSAGPHFLLGTLPLAAACLVGPAFAAEVPPFSLVVAAFGNLTCSAAFSECVREPSIVAAASVVFALRAFALAAAATELPFALLY